MNLVRNYLKIPVSVTLVIIAIISICNLTKSENGLIITKQMTNDTLTIIFSSENAKSNILVFVAHGFAVSTSLMRPIALSLTKTGYKRRSLLIFLGIGDIHYRILEIL